MNKKLILITSAIVMTAQSREISVSDLKISKDYTKEALGSLVVGAQTKKPSDLGETTKGICSELEKHTNKSLKEIKIDEIHTAISKLDDDFAKKLYSKLSKSEKDIAFEGIFIEQKLGGKSDLRSIIEKVIFILIRDEEFYDKLQAHLIANKDKLNQVIESIKKVINGQMNRVRFGITEVPKIKGLLTPIPKAWRSEAINRLKSLINKNTDIKNKKMIISQIDMAAKAIG